MENGLIEEENREESSQLKSGDNNTRWEMMIVSGEVRRRMIREAFYKLEFRN